MKTETITLVRRATGWFAIHSDPRVTELFNTDTIATAFTERALGEVVLREIRRLNPACDVHLSQS